VIDLVREIEAVTLNHQVHHDILESVRRYMEISWNSVDLKVPFNVASLLLIEFLFYLIEKVHSILHVVKSRDLR